MEMTQLHEEGSELYRLGEGELRLYKNQQIEKLFLELTDQCNFSCRMCFRNNFTNPFTMMSDEVLNAVLDNIRNGLPHLKRALVGGIGEPLLHPRVREVLAALKERGVEVSLQTNGVLLNDGMIDFLFEHDIDRVVTSFECGQLGHVEATTLERTITNIAARRKDRGRPNHPRLIVEWILTKSSMTELSEKARELAGMGVNEFILSNMLPVEEQLAEESLIFSPAAGSPDKVAWLHKGDILEPFINALRYRAAVKRPEFHVKTERSCAFIDDNSTVVRNDGAVTACYRLLHDSREYYQGRWRDVQAHSYGNITERSLVEIWNDRDYMWFRHHVRNSLYPSCHDCELRDGCDYILDTTADCMLNSPSCADCLWGRKILICP